MIPSARKKEEKGDENDEVEEMLRAAQDELLLNLSVGSHTTRLPSDRILPDDLDRRFQSLRSNPRPAPPPRRNPTAPSSDPVDDEDLFARFAALKAGPSSSSSGGGGAGLDRVGEDEVAEPEDEVEKIILWAKDAARLDPSPPSDEEESGGDDDDLEEEEDDSSDDEKAVARRKGQRRGS